MDYRILGKLGEGAMGQVFRATQVSLHREVALKMMGKQAATSPDTVERFHRETAILCRLSHPHVVPVYDTGVLGDNPFFTMELIRGTSLADLVNREGPLPFPRVLTLTMQLADALAYLHERGVHHRDIKPQNLVLKGLAARDHLVVVDFGLARTASGRAITMEGESVGTLAYMSPEAIDQSWEAGAPQDVWALGHVAHYLLTGMRPFPGRAMLEIATQILTFVPEKKARLLAGMVPDWFIALLVGCWAKDPQKRLTASKVHQVLADEASQLSLQGFLASQATPAVPREERPGRERPAPLPAPPTKSRRTLPALGLGLLVVGVAATGSLRRETPVPEPAASKAVVGSPATRAWEGTSPISRFQLVPSDRSVLVDFDLDSVLPLVISVTSGASERRSSPAPDRPWVHETIGPLSMGEAYQLRVITTDGRVLVPGLLFRTHGPDRARARDAALESLEEPGLADASLRLFADEPDPAVAEPLARFLATPASDRANVGDIARVASELREPGLAKGLLESRHRTRDLPGILEAGARARVDGVLERMPPEPGALEGAYLVAESLVLRRRKHPASCRKLGEILRFRPLTFSLELVEAMIACDPTAARGYFAEWITQSARHPEVLSVHAMAGAAGAAFLAAGGDGSLLDEVAVILAPGNHELHRGYAATRLADLGGEASRRLVRDAVAAPGAGAVLLDSAARLGLPVFPETGELPAEESAASLARLAAPRLLERPDPALLARVRGMLDAPVAWHRDLAAGMLADWSDRESVPALRARAASDRDAQGVAAFALAKILGTEADDTIAAELERRWSAVPAGSADPGPRMLLTWAAHRVRPGSMMPKMNQRVHEGSAPTCLKDLVRILREESTMPDVDHLWFLPHSTYLRTGLTLTAGESIRVRAWGYHAALQGPGWTAYSRQVRNLGPGTALGMSLHQGGQEWSLSGDFRSFLATRDGPVILGPTMFAAHGSEVPLERLMPGLIRITVDRSGRLVR